MAKDGCLADKMVPITSVGPGSAVGRNPTDKIDSDARLREYANELPCEFQLLDDDDNLYFVGRCSDLREVAAKVDASTREPYGIETSTSHQADDQKRRSSLCPHGADCWRAHRRLPAAPGRHQGAQDVFLRNPGRLAR